MKLYLSGPMTGLPDYNRPAFEAAALSLRAAGYDVINPVEVCADMPEGTDWTEYMRQDIKAMMDADMVALLPGAEKSRGAKIETDLAHALGIPVRTVGYLLARVLEMAR